MDRKLLLLVGGWALALCLAGVRPAHAEVTDNEKISFDGFTVFVPCANGGTGEDVVFTGDLHVLLTFTINRNNVSGYSHFQPQGLTGVGTITGDKYQGTGLTQDHFKGSLQNGQYTETFVNNFRMIGQGPGNNSQLHETFHITFNANGAVTVVQDNLNVTCK